jgi:hypothetical protein
MTSNGIFAGSVYGIESPSVTDPQKSQAIGWGEDQPILGYPIF